MDINSDDVMSNSRCVTGARTPGGQKTLFRLRVGMRGGGAIKTPTELSVSGLGRGPVATKKKRNDAYGMYESWKMEQTANNSSSGEHKRLS